MPTSDSIHLIPSHQITISSDRQRRTIPDTYIAELAESIQRPAGLLHPIIVRPDPIEGPSCYILVVGECRLRAWKTLELLPGSMNGQYLIGIPCRLITDLNANELANAEFEENLKRCGLNWQDEALAYRGHFERMIEQDNIECNEWLEDNPEAEDDWLAVGYTEASGKLGVSARTYRKMVIVGNAVIGEDKEVLACDNASAAAALIERRARRVAEIEITTFGEVEIEAEIKEASDLDIDIDLSEPTLVTGSTKYFDVYEMTFIEFLGSVMNKPKFNFVHCDFPYGKGLHESDLYNTDAKDMNYEDTDEIYWGLCRTLLKAHEYGMFSASCHFMFWFPMDKYTSTVELFEANGFHVDPYPLVWIKSDKMGIIPDPNRGPRRIYETALLMSLGDRKIIKPTVNGNWSPSEKRSSALHVSLKPADMLRDFFRMFIDSDSIVLDPTCGSGTAIEVAIMQRAQYSVGLDINPKCVEHATQGAKAAQNLVTRGL